MKQTNLPLSERCAARSYDIFYAALVHSNHVHIAFDQVARIFLDDGLLCKIQTIEFAALFVDNRLGRIDIFPDILILLHDAPAKADNPS